MRPLRAVVVASSYPRNARDTAGAFLVPLVRALAAQGLEIHVVAPRGDGVENPPGGVAVHHAPYARVREERLYYGGGAPAALRALGVWALPLVVSSVGSLAWHVARLRPDVVYAHWLVPCGVSAALTGAPTVAYAHGTDVAVLERLRAPARALAARWHAVAAPSPALAQRVRQLLKCDVAEVALPVDPRPADQGAVRFDVGYLGRLLPQKGVDVLLDACARQGLSVVVAGDGPDRARLEAHARVLGVHAQFLGWVAPEERGGVFGMARVMAVPSTAAEGAPSVVFEAGAAGKAVVGTRVAGLEDTLGGAFCVAPGDAKALGAMLALVLGDDGFAEQARAHAAALAQARHPDVVGPAHAALLRAAAGR